MGISNDWQIIDGLSYTQFSSIDETPKTGNYMMKASSAEILATAIGWEVVELSDYVQTVTIGSYTYNASSIRLLRPIADADEEPYDYGCMFYGKIFWGSSSGNYYSNACFRLSTGTILNGLIDNHTSMQANIKLLRPTANGAFAFRDSNNANTTFYIDRFINPKNNLNKWGVMAWYNRWFTDLWTGLKFQTVEFSGAQTTFNFGGFVSLVKFTAIASAGVYKATSLYRYILSYGSVEKTIELDGVKYVNVSGKDFYIRLAD